MLGCLTLQALTSGLNDVSHYLHKNFYIIEGASYFKGGSVAQD
jgi:hypothetical protein